MADVVYGWWDVHEGLDMSRDYRWVPFSRFFSGSFPRRLFYYLCFVIPRVRKAFLSMLGKVGDLL